MLPLLPILATLLPLSLSLPTQSQHASIQAPYMCGYVLTRHNSSTYAGISALNACAPFYYNETIHDNQDAFAYKLFKGCECGFFGSWEECIDGHGGDKKWVAGPTEGGEEVEFEEGRAWYRCRRTV